MKRLLVTVALALVSLPSFAAIQYEFVQKETMEDAVTPVSDLTARATIDGTRSRIDFMGGTRYPPGSYAVSTDSSRRYVFVDPGKQWYTEVDASSVATALGASNIKIENFQSKVENLGDKATIAGLEAEHSRLVMSYDVSVAIKGIPLRQHVQTEIDTWSTPQFGDVFSLAFTSGIRTGNPEIDKLLETEASKLHGFPLRQIVTTRTSADLPQSRSELQVPTTKTMVREMWVTAVRETKADPAMFIVPASYRRADVPDSPKATGQVLTFEPNSK